MADNVEKIISVKLDASAAISGIQALNRQIEVNKASMQQMAAQTGKNTTEYIKLDQQTKALTKEKQALQREVQNEIKQESALDGSLVQLRAELARLTKEYDGLSRAEREAGNRGKELKSQINQVTTEIKRAEEGTQRYYRNVGNYKNSILEAIGMNRGFGNSLLMMTEGGGGFKGAMAAMSASVRGFGAALMSLMANPVFLALAGIVGAGMAFKWFWDYNEGIAEANRLTREFTGYTGDNLVVMRNSIQATADVMGKDFKETLQATDAIMSHFHMDGKQALDIINAGFAAGADVNGDFLAKVQQLAPTFHDAGIEADQMVAIITQTRSGIFSDQGLEAIKQGSARIREMSANTRKALQGVGIDVDEMQRKLRDGSMTTFDAVKQVSAAIKELPDNAQEVGEVMQAVFGRQGKFASQEMIESLAEMSTSLDDVKAKTGEYGELLLENINTEEELNNATSALFDMSNRGWEEMKQQATIYAKRALVDVVKGLIDVTNWFVQLYNKSLIVRVGVHAIIAQFRTLWAVVKWAFGNIGNGFKTLGRLIDAFVNAFNKAGEAIAAFGEGVGMIFRGIAERSFTTIQAGVSKIKGGVTSSVASILNGFKVAFTESASDMIDDAKALGLELGNVFADAANDAISNQLQNVQVPVYSGGGYGGGITTSSGGGGSAAGGGSSSGGSSGGGKTGNGKTGKTPQELAQEAYNERVKALVKKGEELKRKALEEEAKTSIAKIEELYQLQIEQFKKVYGEADQYKDEALIAYNLQLEEFYKKKVAAIDAYNKKVAKDAAENAKAVNADARKLAESILEGQEDGSAKQLEWRLKVLHLQFEAEMAELEENERMKLEQHDKYLQMQQALNEKYAKQETDIKKEYADKQREIEQSKYTAAASVVGGLGQMMDSFGESNKKAAKAAKILALGEVMISQAVAIANAVKAGSNAVNPWQMIAQIATSITAVTVAMAQAFNSLNDAKFATGGYIRGAGTGTSDSIPVRVSNGESVMNANTTAMFGGLLSSLNQLGGGVPIQVAESASSIRGEDMLARAVAKGVAMLPNPVVSVEDINRGQRQVEVLNNRAAL